MRLVAGRLTEPRPGWQVSAGDYLLAGWEQGIGTGLSASYSHMKHVILPGSDCASAPHTKLARPPR